jgi:hypothetical protein
MNKCNWTPVELVECRDISKTRPMREEMLTISATPKSLEPPAKRNGQPVRICKTQTTMVKPLLDEAEITMSSPFVAIL